ncbi:hypothetical protein HW132_24885 [Brasilonema sp. CT11]|nr:hypothetical protein [Brasilonema sp. CT11]
MSNRYSTQLSSSQQKLSNLKATLYSYYSNASGDKISIEKIKVLEILKEFSKVDELLYQVLEDIEKRYE